MHNTFRIWFSFSRPNNRKSKTRPFDILRAGSESYRRIQNRKLMGIIALIIAFAMCGAVATAQQPAKIPRIGYLGGVSLSANTARHDAFGQGLGELHYVEGKNIVVDWRSADGKLERLPVLAAEMVRLKLDVIVTSGATATRPPRKRPIRFPLS